jgi:biotin synthase
MEIRNNWKMEEVRELFSTNFNKLISDAHETHIRNFPDNDIQLSSLLSIKTGGCPEDCKYCPQSSHYESEVKASKLMDIETVIEAAKAAKSAGATRFCMGAAWRSPKDKDIEPLSLMIKSVKELGLETCMTLGMLSPTQAASFKEAGLDYYNHNIDTSEEFYKNIITTRTYSDRINTLEIVRDAGINVCCGGILGMGETENDRILFLLALANMNERPESVPINRLVKSNDSKLAEGVELDEIDFIKVIAVARILMPKSRIRLSAGRENMSKSMQALCFYSGANSIFYGEKLLTTGNPDNLKDIELINQLGMNIAA